MTVPNIQGAGAEGQFFIKIGGVLGNTKEILLSNDGFAEGTTTSITIKAVNIGDINKVTLRTTGTDNF